MPAVAAWYHCRVKPVSRSAGRSVVGAAAYRCGDKLHEVSTDQVHDYRRRSGVVAAFGLAPDDAPEWALDPERLWNEADAAEKRKNSTLAREYELALPSSVSAGQREEIARAFAQELVDRYGVAVTVAIHEPSRHGDDRNHHAHILTTTREIGPEGLGAKTRILDDRKTGPQEILYLRGVAANLINEALERAGSDERVDHRSFEERGIEAEPTEHEGFAAREMERKGRESERAERNREIRERNGKLDEDIAELAAIDEAIAAEEERRLNERFGEPELGGLDEATYNPAEAEGPGLEYETAPAGEPAAEETQATGTRLDAFAASVVGVMRENGGDLDMGDGLTWYERVAVVFTAARDRVTAWARDTWQSVVENWHGPDKDEGPDPDLER